MSILLSYKALSKFTLTNNQLMSTLPAFHKGKDQLPLKFLREELSPHIIIWKLVLELSRTA